MFDDCPFQFSDVDGDLVDDLLMLSTLSLTLSIFSLSLSVL